MTPDQAAAGAPSARDRDMTDEADAGIAAPMPPVTAEVVDRPGPAWDQMTAQFVDAAYEQSVAYAASRWGARRLVGIVLRDPGRRLVVAAALAVTVTLPLIGAGFGHVKFGPLWRRRGLDPSPALLTHALIALRRELGERRGLLVRVVPPADPDFDAVWIGALRSAGFSQSGVLRDPERYLVDVSLPDAEQLASFGDRWRAQLRKTAPDLTFEELAGGTALEQFQKVFRSMLRRKGFEDRHGLETLPALLAHPVAAHRTVVFVARHQGEPVALSAIGGAGDTLHALFSATSDGALPLRAGYSLRWWILRRLRDRGVRWLDLGGDEGDEGLRHFKKGCVGKRGRIVSLPGEFDWCDRRVSRLATQVLDLVRGAVVRYGVSRLPRRPSSLVS
jgi:hypothetical protein